MSVTRSSQGNETGMWPSWSRQCPPIRTESDGTIRIRKYGAQFSTQEIRDLFYPPPLLRHIFTERILSTEIGAAIEGLDEAKKDLLAQQVLGLDPTTPGTYIQVFVILKLIFQLHKLPEFICAGVSDQELPLYCDRAQQEEPLFYGKSKIGNSWKPLPDGLLDAFFARSLFRREQYNVVVPVFDNQSAPYDFDWDQVLPIRKITRDEASTEPQGLIGSYGSVSKVQIHPLCHSFNDAFKFAEGPDGEMYFALKELHNANSDSFRKEVEMLRRFHNTKHPHLVTLLASYTHQNRHYLIFPWATHDLRSYWEKEQPTPDSENVDLVQWICKQLWKLSDAVSHIHLLDEDTNVPEETRLYGRHGDLKSENILWYKSKTGFGNLVITDMGLSKTHRFESRTYVPQHQVIATRRYQPPEVEYENGKMGRTFDIWTLGCMFLEFLSWLHGGFKALQNMEDSMRASSIRRRTETNEYFEWVYVEEVEYYTVRVKKVVTKLIETLRRDSSQFTYDLLDIIENRMLVVDRDDRISAKELVEKMKDLDDRCGGDNGWAYCTQKENRQARAHKPKLQKREFRKDLKTGGKDNVPRVHLGEFR
ncbi:kinase-like domain-containing protein [Xylaria digitata]|nr:kinase-like domain-containing protein [Xylaria digitata]